MECKWWEATKSAACTQLHMCYRSIFSVHGSQHVYSQSVDNATSSTSSWVMYYVVCELMMEEKAVSLEATTAALRKH